MTKHKIISQKEAKAKGLKRFFTGLKCKKGHRAERFVSSGACVDCRRTENMTPEQVERRNARKRIENMTPEQIERRRALTRKENLTPEQIEHKRLRFRSENMTPEQLAKQRARQRKHRTGFTPEMIDYVYTKQNGLCAICSRPIDKQTCCADHDHKTGRARGLLCRHCNLAEGYLRKIKLSPREWGRRMQAIIDNPPALKFDGSDLV